MDSVFLTLTLCLTWIWLHIPTSPHQLVLTSRLCKDGFSLSHVDPLFQCAAFSRLAEWLKLITSDVMPEWVQRGWVQRGSPQIEILDKETILQKPTSAASYVATGAWCHHDWNGAPKAIVSTSA
jgi:hypothetical protein